MAKGLQIRLLESRKNCEILLHWRTGKGLPPLRVRQLEGQQGVWSVLFNSFLRQVKR